MRREVLAWRIALRRRGEIHAAAPAPGVARVEEVVVPGGVAVPHEVQRLAVVHHRRVGVLHVRVARERRRRVERAARLLGEVDVLIAGVDRVGLGKGHGEHPARRDGERAVVADGARGVRDVLARPSSAVEVEPRVAKPPAPCAGRAGRAPTRPAAARAAGVRRGGRRRARARGLAAAASRDQRCSQRHHAQVPQHLVLLIIAAARAASRVRLTRPSGRATD